MVEENQMPILGYAFTNPMKLSRYICIYVRCTYTYIDRRRIVLSELLFVLMGILGRTWLGLSSREETILQLNCKRTNHSNQATAHSHAQNKMQWDFSLFENVQIVFIFSILDLNVCLLTVEWNIYYTLCNVYCVRCDQWTNDKLLETRRYQQISLVHHGAIIGVQSSFSMIHDVCMSMLFEKKMPIYIRQCTQ